MKYIKLEVQEPQINNYLYFQFIDLALKCAPKIFVNE